MIRGGTAHFEYVAGEAAKGIAAVQNSTGVPIAFGVLTVDTIEQAIERSGTKAGNKGAEAAMSAVELSPMALAGAEGVSSVPPTKKRQRTPLEHAMYGGGGGLLLDLGHQNILQEHEPLRQPKHPKT